MIVRQNQRVRVMCEGVGDDLPHGHRNAPRQPIAVFGQADNCAPRADKNDPQNLDLVRHGPDSGIRDVPGKLKLRQKSAIPEEIIGATTAPANLRQARKGRAKHG